MTLKTKINTALALGLPNLARVFYYRLSVRLNINPVRKITATIPSGRFFSPPSPTAHQGLEGNTQWQAQHCYFGWQRIDSSAIPDWYCNPFNQQSVQAPRSPWWSIPDFDPELGDIKTVWEASRFDWLLGFAQRASQGDVASLDSANSWLKDWGQNNPPYLGPNWKCGQEASIRVMHIAMAALILDQIQSPEPPLIALIAAHLERIAPTISYAIAQDNNHGTSEAAALFIGGSWLHSLGYSKGKKWQQSGRKWLENRANRLIENDGSFSQYSVTYHRLMLDTFSMVEVWRRSLEITEFSALLYTRLQQASNWLYQFTQADTGDAPNLGANDGARLLPLSNADYRDFRPSVQLATALFSNRRAWQGEGDWNEPLHWLRIPIPNTAAKPQSSQHFDRGGYSLLRGDKACVLLNYPRFRFRPSQSDALHLDFWLAGENLLRDGGTYSYNAGDEPIRYFGGTEGHNTIQFDDREQMPRLSRFLLGDWLYADNIQPPQKSQEGQQCGAGYTDGLSASHHRTAQLSNHKLRVDDQISGFQRKAILRWRLKPGDWKLKDYTLYNNDHSISISADMPIYKIALIEGAESRYYLNKTATPILEVEVHHSGCLVTEYTF